MRSACGDMKFFFHSGTRSFQSAIFITDYFTVESICIVIPVSPTNLINIPVSPVYSLKGI